MRATKLACTRSRRLAGFLDEFWPDPPRAEHFQPEPGCSSPTFRGSAAEATALAGIRLTAIAGELGSCEAATHAVAHLVALPTADHRGTRSACLELPAATVLADSATRFEVRLSAAAAAQLRAGIASARRRLGPEPETGGVLFGERDDAAGLIWIDEATGPPPDSGREKPSGGRRTAARAPPPGPVHRPRRRTTLTRALNPAIVAPLREVRLRRAESLVKKWASAPSKVSKVR